MSSSGTEAAPAAASPLWLATAAPPHESVDGAVVVPEDYESGTPDETDRTGTIHTEIQYLLAKLGADMGFDVHVASNDQGRVRKGVPAGRHAAP